MVQSAQFLEVRLHHSRAAFASFNPVGIPGERVTSTYRTPEHNREVGGVPNSWHTRKGPDGRPLAIDSVPPAGMSLSNYYANLRRLNPNLDVILERDHVHREPRGR
jgi:hypothetical protein